MDTERRLCYDFFKFHGINHPQETLLCQKIMTPRCCCFSFHEYIKNETLNYETCHAIKSDN